MNNHIVAVDRDGKPFIAHYGVQGQKWGVRNYQNTDGSLTEEGRERYGVSESHNTEVPSGALERRVRAARRELQNQRWEEFLQKHANDTNW